MRVQDLDLAQLAISGIGELDRADGQAVTAVMTQLRNAFAHRNSAHLDDIFAEDVDWFTGLGSAVKGREAVTEHLRQHFSRPDFPRATVTSVSDWLLRRLDDDTVVVLAPLQLVGTGRPPSERDPRSVHVLSRLDSGAWHVTMQLFPDPRVDHRFTHPQWHLSDGKALR